MTKDFPDIYVSSFRDVTKTFINKVQLHSYGICACIVYANCSDQYVKSL